MSRTIRTYNKPNYFRRTQYKHGFAWIYIPQYHPFKQCNMAAWHRCDEGVTRRWLTKRRRMWYKAQMYMDIVNL